MYMITNKLNFYTKLYSYFYPRKWLPRKILAFGKSRLRKIANRRVPGYLAKPCHYSAMVHKNLIVSFTSFPERIDEVWQVVECVKRQSILPEKILLWLSEDQFSSKQSIPESLKVRIDDIFEVRWVKGNIRSHKKYYYVLEEYPHADVILIDDDIHYPTNMIEKLLKAKQDYPNSILCRYGYIMQYEKDGNLKSYKKWKHNYSTYNGENLFFGSGGGTLLRKKLLYPDVLNLNLSQKLVPTADDIWLNAMANLQRTNIVMLPAGRVLSFNTHNKGKLSLVNIAENQNDVQIGNVRKYYLDKLGIDPFENKIIRTEQK